MTSPNWSRRVTSLALMVSALLAGPTLPAQVAGRPAAADVRRAPLDTAAILTSARPEIDAALKPTNLLIDRAASG